MTPSRAPSALLGVVLAAMVAACSAAGTDAPGGPGAAASLRAGAPSTALGVQYAAADLVTGERVSLDSLLGGPVLLSSWATWCEPCRTELPALERLHQATQAQGLRIVTVNVDAPGLATTAAGDLLDELGVTMPRWRDELNVFRRTFHPIGVPTNVLLDARGQVVQTWMGAIDPDEPEVVAALTEVLGEPPGEPPA